MPYIKSGVLNDLANRKILGRFNTKYEMTGKTNVLIIYQMKLHHIQLNTV